MSKWATLLEQALTQAEPVPKGFKTVEQIAAETGRSRPTTDHLVRALFKAGKLEQKKIRIKTGSRIFPVPHYREVKK